MDGVLVDTRKAVRAAYERAGASPLLLDRMWGRPWTDWCPKDVHERKNAIYPVMLCLYAHELPALRILQECGGSVLTSASPRAVQLVQEYVRYPFHVIGTSCNTAQKITAIQRIRGGAVYVDDDVAKGLAVQEGTGCRFVHARTDRVGHYDLYDSTQKVTASWTSSFWPQDVTNV